MAVIDPTQGNFAAYDRFQTLVDKVGQYKEQRRVQEIDEKAMGMLQQGSRPDDVERFLISEMTPRQRGGLGGLAQRLVGGGAPLQMSPMQQQVMSRQAETHFPTPTQARAADAHPLEMDYLQSQTERMKTLADPTLQQLGSIGDVIGRLTRDHLVAEDYADEIRGLTQSYQSLVERIMGSQNTGAASQSAATPWEGPNPGVTPMQSRSRPRGQQPAGQAGTPRMTPETAGQGRYAQPNVQMRTDTPAEVAQLIRDAMAKGIPIEEIMSDAEVAPYVVRRK